jgi:Na+/proline symporter
LTEWTRQRYGAIAGLFLSICTLITMFLYMVAELSALQQIVNLLTGLNGLPVVIVECAVTTIYTSLGGFKVSFVTDNIQGAMVVGLIILGVIAVGVETDIQRPLIEQSGYLNSSLLGWQLLYILPVAVLTNDFFLSGFWMRTFASRTDKDLWIGVSLASVGVLIILTLVGVAGLLAAWSGAWDMSDVEGGSLALFLLLEQLPNWVVGVVLVMTISLSTAAFDSFQSAMISTGSNDFFRNKLNIWIIRACVVAIIFPVVVVALRSPDILQIFLISDLVSAAVVPCLVIGLNEKFYWYRGFDFVVGGLGGIFTIFLFGLVYYNGDSTLAGRLLLLEGGLYANDWSAFGKSPFFFLIHAMVLTCTGAFVAAPFGGLLWAFGACALRISALWVWAKVKGHRFDALDRPVPRAISRPGAFDADENATVLEHSVETGKSGKFF